MKEVNGVPVIKTINLTLRRLEERDASDLFLMRSNPKTIEFADGKLDREISDTMEYIVKINAGIDQKKWITWGIEHRESGKIIGVISLWNLIKDDNSGEFGYGLNPGYQGKGYMREALREVIEYALDYFLLDTVYAYTSKDNIPSLKLLEKCGFLETGRVIEEGIHSDRVFEYKVYRIGKKG